MTILLAAASIARGRPAWFEKTRSDWLRLTLASAMFAAVVELLAAIVGIFTHDYLLWLRLSIFAPLVYCIAQSFATDTLYRRADAVSLSLASVFVMLTEFVNEPLWIAGLIVVLAVAYFTMRSDGLALVLTGVSILTTASDEYSLVGGIIFAAAVLCVTGFVYSARPKATIPMVPIAVSVGFLAAAMLVVYDIAF